MIYLIEYLNEYFNENLEGILFTLPSVCLFLGGYYITICNYTKNTNILKNIEKVKLDIDTVKSRDNKHLTNEIKKLKDKYEKTVEENNKYLNKIEELSLKIIDKNKKISEYDKKLEENNGMKLKLRELEKKSEEIKDNGGGVLRYKNEEGTIYYHGMGHLEQKYSWWKPYMNRKICQYTNLNRKLKFPDYETHTIDNFCTNYEYCTEINKNKRNMFYYECKGHKINID